MRLIATPLLISVAIAAGGASAGCQQRGEAVARPLRLVVSGDTQGWIVPCGCTTNQSGGLLRRGTYLRQLRQQSDVIYVDAGGALSGTPAYDRAKFAAILRGEAALNVAAHNLGAAEVELGPDDLRQLAKESHVPLVSANARDAQGEQIAPAYHLLSTGGRRVLIVGVLSEQYQTSAVSITPPQPAILHAIQQTANQWDFVIVLAYLPEGELRALAAGLPEVDAVIGGPTGQAIAPQALGPTLLAAATNKGKFIVEIELPAPAAPRRLTGSIVELNDRFTNDPRQQENLAELYRLLAARDFSPDQTSFAPRTLNHQAGYRIAGVSRCRACHAADCAAWDETPHAHAWETLVAEGAHVDSYCQQCHTTGYGEPGGFRSVQSTTQQVAVGCESCHGPSLAHAEEPTRHTAYYQTAAGQCVRCHDHENSPHFEYDAYWAQITHGQPANRQAANQPAAVLPVDAGAKP